MQSSQLAIPIDEAITRCLCQTSVLIPYKGGSMIQLQRGGVPGNFRTTYKVTKDLVTVAFKSITCNKGDHEKIRQIKEEFKLSIEAYKAASDGVVTPISFAETDDRYLPEHIIELVYEYGGDNILTALKNADGKKIIEVMVSVAKIMSKLENHKIFHSDIKPENIVISNGVVKILDCGVSMVFDNKTSMVHTKALKGGFPYFNSAPKKINKMIYVLYAKIAH